MKNAMVVLIVMCITAVSAFCQETIKSLADKAGLTFGTAVGSAFYSNTTAYINAIKTEYNAVVCENEMKIDATEPSRNSFRFTNPDKLVLWSQQNNIKVRGHTLVWHSQCPSWITDGTWTRESLLAVMKNHIDSVAGHFKGKIFEWDVVNEAFDDNTSNGLRSSVWKNTIGEDFIDSAFAFAHRADPSALLFYNDYNTSFVNAKSTNVYNKIKKMLENKIPIHGVGFQSHQGIGDNTANLYSKVKENFDRFAALGLKISITEMDVAITLPIDANKRIAEAKIYSAFMRAALATPACRTFMVWGASDRYSWLNNSTRGTGLVLDSNFQRAKPVYDTLVQVLKSYVTSTNRPSSSKASNELRQTSVQCVGNNEIVVDGIKGNAQLTILGLDGRIAYNQLIMENERASIPISNHRRGIYIVMIQAGATVVVQPIMLK
jgi:endo-1,4-beta-xylanase